MFAAKFSPTGAHLWSQRFPGWSDDYAYAGVVDSNGNVILAGNFGLNIDFGAGVIDNAGGRASFVAEFAP